MITRFMSFYKPGVTFNLVISEKELADLAFKGLRSYLKEKLEGFEFLTVNHLQMRVLGLEFRLKEAKDTYKTHRSNTHFVDHDSNSSDDEEKEVYAAEFVWPSKAKSSSCPSLKPTQKNQQNEVKFTFDVSKCDCIFNELLKNGNIRLSHAIPSVEELKRNYRKYQSDDSGGRRYIKSPRCTGSSRCFDSDLLVV